MRVFVTGVNGQLGHDVVNRLEATGHEAIASDLKPCYSGLADGSFATKAPYVQLDITKPCDVKATLEEIRPDAIVHCAAWTAVDAAEEKENYDTVYAVNVLGTKNIALAAKKIDAKMVYISTDYVFNGQGTDPWDEETSKPSPLNVYGATKFAAEEELQKILTKFFIVRTAWVFGLNGKNFVRTMLYLAKTHHELRIIDDQIGTPTYTFDLARLLVDMIETDKYGIYHATNEGGFISWAQFAKEIFRQNGDSVKVQEVSTAEYGLSKAKRPFNSRLSKGKLVRNGFVPLPEWKEALSRYIQEAKENRLLE